MTVVDFIQQITAVPDHDGKESSAITRMFCDGYCYYFACILKEAFGRGTICWCEGRGHIVWKDTDGVAYDAYGVYDDAELRPVEYLGDMLVDFKHTGEVFTTGNPEFIQWCEEENTSELVALQRIWLGIPKDKLSVLDETDKTLPEIALS